MNSSLEKALDQNPEDACELGTNYYVAQNADNETMGVVAALEMPSEGATLLGGADWLRPITVQEFNGLLNLFNPFFPRSECRPLADYREGFGCDLNPNVDCRADISRGRLENTSGSVVVVVPLPKYDPALFSQVDGLFSAPSAKTTDFAGPLIGVGLGMMLLSVLAYICGYKRGATSARQPLLRQ